MFWDRYCPLKNLNKKQPEQLVGLSFPTTSNFLFFLFFIEMADAKPHLCLMTRQSLRHEGVWEYTGWPQNWVIWALVDMTYAISLFASLCTKVRDAHYAQSQIRTMHKYARCANTRGAQIRAILNARDVRIRANREYVEDSLFNYVRVATSSHDSF